MNGNSDGLWALHGVGYWYAGSKSYLGLRDLLGVGFLNKSQTIKPMKLPEFQNFKV